MKRLLLLFTLVLFFAFLSVAQATSFTFSGTDPDIGNIGIGSATMDINISGNILTATLDNVSPIYLYLNPDGSTSGYNAPGITGFGFNLTNGTLPVLDSWELTAYENVSGSPVTIGSSSTSNEWVMDTTIAGVSLDFLTRTDRGVNGSLFNPSFAPFALTATKTDGTLLVPSGSNNAFYTTAILIMNYDSEPVLDTTSGPFVRMQNVGLDGEGSLKLYPTDPIPEPATMLLLGSGLIGFAVSSKKRFKKRNG